MSQIDVITVVDATSLLGLGNPSQDQQHPTEAPSNYVFMVTTQGNALSGNGSSALQIVVNTGDVVALRARGATLSPTYTIAIYAIAFDQGQDLLGAAQLNEVQMQSYYPTHIADPLQFSAQQITVPFWSISALKGGSATGRCSFAILQSGHETPLGYYSAQIAITVQQPYQPALLDVATIIDTANIVKLGAGSQDPKQPTEVSAGKYIFMVTEGDGGIEGSGGGRLWLSATPTDQIRWSTSSLALPAQYRVVVYEFAVTSGEHVLSNPTITVETDQMPIPDPNNPLDWQPQPVPTSFWSTEVLGDGMAACRISYAILDGAQQLKGYYSSSLCIMIVEPTRQAVSPKHEA